MARRNGKDPAVAKTPLDMLFASSARTAVLRLFMLDPMRAYYQRQIEAVTGLAIRAVQRELERLSGMELLYRRTEGNRAYYQVDVHFPLFPELRGMVLKTSDEVDQLRGRLALDESVVLAFLREEEGRLLLVTAGGQRPALEGEPGPFEIEVMEIDAFMKALTQRSPSLDPFLREGVDILGRREDVIWRRIEAAGYDVKKGKGVV